MREGRQRVDPRPRVSDYYFKNKADVLGSRPPQPPPPTHARSGTCSCADTTATGQADGRQAAPAPALEHPTLSHTLCPSYARHYSSERALPVNLLTGGTSSPASALEAFAPVELPPAPAAVALAAVALSNSSSPVVPRYAVRAAVRVRRTCSIGPSGRALRPRCVRHAGGRYAWPVRGMAAARLYMSTQRLSAPLRAIYSMSDSSQRYPLRWAHARGRPFVSSLTGARRKTGQAVNGWARASSGFCQEMPLSSPVAACLEMPFRAR